MGEPGRINRESLESTEAMASVPIEVEQEELQRIRAAYARRKRFIAAERYARTNPFHLYSLHEREAAMASLLDAAGLHPLIGLKILDVGCGRGDTLRQLLDYGAEPTLLFGLDLLEERVLEASRLGPHLQIVCGNAMRLPFPDASFDLILQFMVFTSVLNSGVKRAIANEIRRVLVFGGKLLWYDFSYNNPNNADVCGIKKAEILQLFPGFAMTLRRVTLAPPLGRIVAQLSPAVYYALAQFRPLCTHYICLLGKPSG